MEIEVLTEGSVSSPQGFAAAAVKCGLKQSGNLDLALVISERDCTAAGLFTRNQVVAAPVLVDRATLASNRTGLRAVVANAGIANACTGEPGLANARAMQVMTAEQLHCRPDQVLVLSTGVIGVQLPMDRVQAGIAAAVQAVDTNPTNGRLAAQAIMTTDTRPKQLALQVKLPGGMVTIGGMAKGAGMIHPDMATMLAVLTTDAAVAPELLDDFLRVAVEQSFNRISVDGDTSTNDTVLLLANGASGVSVADEPGVTIFGQALTYMCTALAQMIVRDGEGATKFVELIVSGAPSAAEAHLIARTVATSPLVKTAFAGSDPNWGRILAAAGRAGVPFDQNQVNLWVSTEPSGELQLVAQGTPTAYDETEAAAVLAQPAFRVRLEIGPGEGTALMWTTDLTHDYVTINADYRT